VSAIVAAGLVGIISIANGAGRFLWAWLSDFIGRKWVFLAMFLIQAVVFFLMPRATTFGLFTVLAFIVLLCYGGGFGTMPAFAADYFGPKNVGSVYGLMLTAWGVAGIVGPTLIARIRESTGAYSNALYVTSGIMLVSAIIPSSCGRLCRNRKPPPRKPRQRRRRHRHGTAPPEPERAWPFVTRPLGTSARRAPVAGESLA
jgi:MFS transporter, OFA family, oxalate/formate antiporter